MTVKDVVFITPRRETIWQNINPLMMLRDLWAQRHLIWQLAVRDLAGRYKGSSLGLLWLIVSPLLMLTVYTFVFSVVFHSKFPNVPTAESRWGFAMAAFAGLVVFNVFSECVNRAPYLVLGSANYVKKVVFPLQVLPASMAVSSLLVAAVSTGILLVATSLLTQRPGMALLAFPLVLLPVALLGLGLGWFLASLAVFIRDTCQIVGVVTQVIFFTTPVFFPASAIPQPYRTIILLNPLSHLVEGARRCLIWGLWPDWRALLAVTAGSALVAQFGYAWFMRSKRGFADVI